MRVDVGQAVDPETVVPGAVAIVGRVGGDVSSLIESLVLAPSGREITVRLSAPLPDADVFTLSLTGVLRTVAGRPLPSNGAIDMKVLAGDVDGSGEVTASDILAVRANAGKPADAATQHCDVDDSGQITGSDMLAVRGRIGRRLP